MQPDKNKIIVAKFIEVQVALCDLNGNTGLYNQATPSNTNTHANRQVRSGRVNPASPRLQIVTTLRSKP